MRDSTGNRRYWPIAVGKNKTIKNVFEDFDSERDQIWAEAVTRFKIGEPLFIEGDVLKTAEKEQSERLIIDPWESIIAEYLQRPIPKDWFDRSIENQRNYWLFNSEEAQELVERDRICAGEILSICLNIEPKRQTSSDRKRVIDVLKKCRSYSYKNSIRFGAPYGVTSGFIRV